MEQYVSIRGPEEQPGTMEVGWFSFYDNSFGLDNLEYRAFTPKAFKRLVRTFEKTHVALTISGMSAAFGWLYILYPNEASIDVETLVQTVFQVMADTQRKATQLKPSGRVH